MAAIKTLQYRISIHVCGVSFFVKLFRITARGSRPGECFFCNQGTLIDYVFPSIKLSLGNHTVGSMYIQTISKLKPTMWFGSTFSFWFFHVQRFYLIIQNHSRAVNPQTKKSRKYLSWKIKRLTSCEKLYPSNWVISILRLSLSPYSAFISEISLYISQVYSERVLFKIFVLSSS